MSSQRPRSPVETGGKLVEWEKQTTPYQLENGLIISICNDDDNLYVLFSPDWRYKKQLHILAKMTLWLDKTGKDSKNIGFAYDYAYFPASPREMQPGEEVPFSGQIEAAGTLPPLLKDPEFIKKMAASRSQIRVIDNINRRETIVPADGSMGPKVIFSSEWGDYTYRWRIPLKGTAGSNAFRFNVQPGQVIGIGVAWEPKRIYDPRKMMKKQAQRSFGRRPPGSGGPMPPDDGFPTDQIPRKRKAWFRITLSQKE